MSDEFESVVEEPKQEPAEDNVPDTVLDNALETAEPVDVEKSDDMSFLDGLQDDRAEVKDEAYRDASIPDDAEGYQLAESDTGNELIEDTLLKGFKTFAHEENISQGLFARIVSFSLKASTIYTTDAEVKVGIKGFCQQNHINRELAEKLMGFINNANDAKQKTIEEVQKYSRAVRGRPGNEARAAKIAKVRDSKAYQEKGVSIEDVRAHKTAVKLLLELCKQ